MKVTCEKCGKEIDSKGLHNHLKFCKGTGELMGNTAPGQQVEQKNEATPWLESATEWTAAGQDLSQLEEEIEVAMTLPPRVSINTRVPVMCKSGVIAMSTATPGEPIEACFREGCVKHCIGENICEEFEPTMQEAEPKTVFIPISMCPDMAYLHENRQYFFRVAGRKLGDRLVVEEVKLLVNG